MAVDSSKRLVLLLMGPSRVSTTEYAVARPVYVACAPFSIEVLLAMHCCSEIQLAMSKIQPAHASNNTIMNSNVGSVD